MTMSHANDSTGRKPLRLWPGVATVVVQWLLFIGVPLATPDYAVFGMLGGVAGGAIVLLWWLFFSRAPWVERIGAIVIMVVAVLAAYRFVHPSIANGFMGRMLPLFSVPPLCLALVTWASATRTVATGPRRAWMVVAILLAAGALTLVRTEGITGAGASDLHWRWTMTPEERLLAQARDNAVNAAQGRPVDSARVKPAEPPAAPVPAPTADKPVPAPVSAEPPAPATAPATKSAGKPPLPKAESTRAMWNGFRGPGRDGVIRGARIETDWSKSPPVELWRRPIGPGWSSFAVDGDLIFTQEQRGDQEVVSSYRRSTGEPVWRHSDAVRFYESNGGPGPRGTPALHDGRVYTLGATGIVNALDASDGSVVWSRNAAADTGAPLPGWGFTGSPLVVDDTVIVAASGRLAAYEAGTGKPRWTQKTAGGGYSSPHLAMIDGVAQIVLLSGGGATGVAPADGAVLWQHKWEEGVSIVQPALTENGDILISGGDSMGGIGMRRLAVARRPTEWTVEERWTTRGLKPYFNDFVVHKGHAFGFDGTILACIDLTDGTRKWKGGRYGAGQLVVLADQDTLLVLSEEGELALVSATPDKHTELARFKAIEGKTWNHPVLVGDVVLARNGEEMAAFRLPTGR
jgi:outer membrane protein assembly factor BamB